MIEEKYNEIKRIKEQIEKLERNIHTIESLIKSVNLGMEITGTSDCKFKIKRFISLGGDNFIKSILDSERKTTEYQLSKLKEEFDKL